MFYFYFWVFTTTELSHLLTSSVTAVMNHYIKYCESLNEMNDESILWSTVYQGRFLVN